MSVTDELRAELTKRGIEWRWEDERTTYWYVTVDGEEWGEWIAIEMGGYLHLSFSSEDVLTPAQAIAATLGAGVCHMEYCLELSNDELYPTEAYQCSACGEVTVEGKPNYCPSCGAKVVDG